MFKSVLFAGSFGIVLLSLVGSGPSAGQVRTGEKQAAHFQKCAEECNNCQRACDACATHCAHLMMEGHKHHFTTLQTCQDCATHCSAAATIVARQGPFSDTICKACAEACARCAKECEQHGSNDAVMKRCADECKRCEQACKDMIVHMTGTKTVAPRNK